MRCGVTVLRDYPGRCLDENCPTIEPTERLRLRNLRSWRCGWLAEQADDLSQQP